ncbi:MAG: helix-turn-helix transcriptional regulator [Bacillota bacterium]|nr:helix-turn-helix transcriptional regulator [Bacillota bacterium]
MRKSKGLTQKQLSRFSGVSKSMISAIECEERNPSVPVLYSLSVVLKVDISELISIRRGL